MIRSHRYHRSRRLAFENLESRLALTWVGVPPTSVLLPATPAAVTLNSLADATGTASIASTEVDYYAFTATRSGSYVISTSTPTSSVDTVLGVFSASGQRLAYNDDIVLAINTDSRLTINLTAGTRYYIGITNYTGSSRGSYNWTIDGPNTDAATDDAYENNDSFSTAANLGTLSASRTISQLVMADSQDWFRLTTTATSSSSNTVSISFQNSQGNLQLALYNSAGTLVGTSQGTGNTESISLNGLAAGTYYALVYGNAGVLNPSYSLIVSAPTTPTTTTTTTTTPTTTGGFQITLSMAGLTASQQSIFQQAAARWEQVITGDLPNATYRGQTVDDILISASATSIDGVNGILGQAGPDAFRSGSFLPYHGIMQFDSADMASMESTGLLFSVILHEMGHVLGIGTIWEDKGLLSGAGTSNPIFVGAQATAAYNQIYGTSARGVPVENTGGAGTADGHWRETVFSNELMTGWAGPGTNLPLSRVTVASLADLGYTVNLSAADSYTPTSSARALAATAARSSNSILAYTDSTTTADATTTSLAAVASPAARPFARSLNTAESPLRADLVDYLMAASSDDHSNDDAPIVERRSAAAESSNPWHDLALTDNAFLALPQLQA